MTWLRTYNELRTFKILFCYWFQSIQFWLTSLSCECVTLSRMNFCLLVPLPYSHNLNCSLNSPILVCQLLQPLKLYNTTTLYKFVLALINTLCVLYAVSFTSYFGIFSHIRYIGTSTTVMRCSSHLHKWSKVIKSRITFTNYHFVLHFILLSITECLRKKYGVADYRYFKNGNIQQCNIFRHNKYNFRQ